VTPVMGASGADVESPLSVLHPRRLLFSGVVNDNELAWGGEWGRRKNRRGRGGGRARQRQRNLGENDGSG
jgi:hypothetical protein